MVPAMPESVEPASADVLALLSPWAIAASMPAPQRWQTVLRAALATLLQALRPGSSDAERLALIELSLAGLPEAAAQPVQNLERTGTHLSAEEVIDYNRYFSVQHVEADEPALCQVRSLLEAGRCFLQLRERLPDLDAAALETQVEGLRCHAHLLARGLSLEPLESWQP